MKPTKRDELTTAGELLVDLLKTYEYQARKAETPEEGIEFLIALQKDLATAQQLTAERIGLVEQNRRKFPDLELRYLNLRDTNE